MRLRLIAGLVLSALSLAACGGSDTSSTVDAPIGSDGRPVAGRMLPMAVGDSWTYAVTPTGMPSVQKTSTVQALEDVGGTKAGVMAFRVRTEKVDGATVSWQADTGSAIVRHREQVFDLAGTMTSEQYYTPSKLRVDDVHLTTGATWVDTYTEESRNVASGVVTPIAKSETWTVEADAEAVTVPAGTFVCVRLRRTGAAGAADKRYWFSPGVGKVKEVGAGSTEELVSYTLR